MQASQAFSNASGSVGDGLRRAMQYQSIIEAHGEDCSRGQGGRGKRPQLTRGCRGKASAEDVMRRSRLMVTANAHASSQTRRSIQSTPLTTPAIFRYMQHLLRYLIITSQYSKTNIASHFVSTVTNWCFT